MNDQSDAERPSPAVGSGGREAKAGGAPSLESALKAVLEIATDAIIAIDESQHIVFFNRGAERIFGYEAAEVLARPLDILLPERHRAGHEKDVRAFGRSRVGSRLMGERMEISGRRKGGEEFPAEASISQVRVGGRTIFTTVLRDVSERVGVRERLEQRERQLAEAQALARLGSWEWDIDDDTIVWSDELYRIYGLAAPTPIDFDSFLERIHPDDRDLVRTTVARAYETAAPFEMRHRIVLPDGTVRWLHGRGEVVIGKEGGPVRMIGTAQDITEQKLAEEQGKRLAAEQAARQAAQSAERRMSFLADASAELVSTLDYEETLRTVARLAVPDLADWCSVHVVDDRGEVRRLAVEHQDPAKVELVRKMLETYPPNPDAPSGSVHVIQTGDSEFVADIPDSLLVASARSEEHLSMIRQLGLRSYIGVPLVTRGRVLGAFAVAYGESGRRYTAEDLALIEDLGRRAATAIEHARLVGDLENARTRLEQQAAALEVQAEELRSANETLIATASEAKAAVREREEVIAIVSHDLRDPLHTIHMASSLLAGKKLTAEAREAQAAVIGRAVEQMDRLIQDLVEAARIGAGRLTIEASPEDAARLVAEAVDLARPMASAKTARVELSLLFESAPIRADRARVLQVFSNLLGNAIRYTPAGGRIVVRAEHTAREVRFSIADEGPGIEPDHLPHLFDRFWQAKRSHRAGAGLGLAIAKGIVDAHAGRIWVESEPDRGSTFHFTLPIAGSD